VKAQYLLAIGQGEALPLEALSSAFHSDEVELSPVKGSQKFKITSGEVDLLVSFEGRRRALEFDPKLLIGNEESRQAVQRARAFYRIAFEPAKPQPSVAVFEALWCARTLMEQIPGVLIDLSAQKIHQPEDVAEITELEFDIRDHLNLHAVEVTEGQTPLWVHSHGMEKFGARDIEAFQLGEDDLRSAETFFHELCTDLAFGHGPGVRTAVATSAGLSFMLVPSEEARTKLMGVPLDSFEGHEGVYFTIVSADGRHTVAELLRPYRTRFEQETPEEAEALLKQAQQLLPAFKARFHRRGLMEPITFLARSSFDIHPTAGESTEDLWFEILTWEDQVLVGKMVDGGSHTTEWRKGATVEVEEDQINAIALGREGKTLEEEEMGRLLTAERPV